MGVPTAAQWRQFSEAQKFDISFPGIQGLGYALVFRPDDLEAFEASQREAGHPTFAVTPPGPRDRMTAIVYLEPEDWRNKRAIGYDMLSEPIRRAAMLRAEQTREPSLSGRVTLLQETNENQQAGTLMYLPVLKPDGSTAAFVYAAFRMNDLISQVTKSQAPHTAGNVALRIYDGPIARPDAILFEGHNDATSATRPRREPKYEHSLTLPVAGAVWSLAFTSTSEFEDSVSYGRTVFIAVVGSLLSGLIASIVGSIAHAQVRNAAAAEAFAREAETRRCAEEASGLANRELIHRAKNTIAVVSALASQTARHSSSLSGFMDDFRTRLSALARIQDMLRPDANRATELADLVEAVLKPYTTDVEAKLSVRGGAVPVPQNEAMVMSLVLNELATNATKYGAWSVPGGRVALDWSVDRDAVPPNLKVSWEESGGPDVAPPTRRGFGSSVLTFVIERSMNGRLVTQFARSGIRHQFLVPWPGL
ncbi:MAG: CHASE domain-containing protein [Hyphomicrobiaceae bacterium]|nr:CHASE domain-containing protein [Hyphomicrobiaceae bacterium]